MCRWSPTRLLSFSLPGSPYLSIALKTSYASRTTREPKTPESIRAMKKTHVPISRTTNEKDKAPTVWAIEALTEEKHHMTWEKTYRRTRGYVNRLGRGCPADPAWGAYRVADTAERVKPCSREEEINRASQEPAHGAASMGSEDHKGYMNILQEKVFHGLIMKNYVTFIELSKQLYSVKLVKKLK